MKRRKNEEDRSRDGFKLVCPTPSKAVGMLIYRDRIIVALEDGIYELKDDKLEKIGIEKESE